MPAERSCVAGKPMLSARAELPQKCWAVMRLFGHQKIPIFTTTFLQPFCWNTGCRVDGLLRIPFCVPSTLQSSLMFRQMHFTGVPHKQSVHTLAGKLQWSRNWSSFILHYHCQTCFWPDLPMALTEIVSVLIDILHLEKSEFYYSLCFSFEQNQLLSIFSTGEYFFCATLYLSKVARNLDWVGNFIRTILLVLNCNVSAVQLVCSF